ncbi:MAG: hypothetical protein J6J71_01995 [Prevotella sp.]|nr:hypothetical protein [Prevotella sp.]
MLYIKTNVIYLPLSSSTSFYLRMSRRYRKLQEDMPLSASKIDDDTLASWCSTSKQMSFISLYLHLSSSIFMFE